MEIPGAMTYRFDEYELDPARFELRRQGRACPVEPQVFALLKLLVENRHRMVPRQEIIRTIWSGRLISDSALSSRVKVARKALNDDGVTQRYIRTVHGMGFRFVGEVESVPEQAQPTRPAPSTAPGWVSEVLSRPIIAVLPFRRESDEDSYLVDGVADELIAQLSSWRWFPILSRSSSLARGNAEELPSVRARALGARYALTGSLRRAREGARLTVELIDTSADAQLWFSCIECAAPEVSMLPARVAAEVFHRLEPEITSAETRRILCKRSEDLNAWDLTMKGLWHLHRATAHDFSRSLELLQEATHADPGFALPWSFIALARFEMALGGWTGAAGGSIRDTFREMLAAADMSVGLDPSGWMGHALKGAGELWTNSDLPTARLHANRAIELNPSASMSYHFSGCIHGFAGDLGQAIDFQGKVYRVDPGYPHSDVVEADLGLWFLLRGDFPQSGRHLSRALELNPRNLRALQRKIALAGLRGTADVARAALKELRDLGGTTDKAYLRDSYPFQNPEHAARFHEGLAFAGLGLSCST